MHWVALLVNPTIYNVIGKEGPCNHMVVIAVQYLSTIVKVGQGTSRECGAMRTSSGAE
jgi:hypothetical protein